MDNTTLSVSESQTLRYVAQTEDDFGGAHRTSQTERAGLCLAEVHDSFGKMACGGFHALPNAASRMTSAETSQGRPPSDLLFRYQKFAPAERSGGELVLKRCAVLLARSKTPQRPEDLKDHDGISFRGFPIAPEWRYRKDSPALAVEPRTRLAVNSTEAAVDAALAGLGIIRCSRTRLRTSCGLAACSPSWRSSRRSRCRSAWSIRTQAYRR